MKNVAKNVYARMTSFANYSQMNGIPREHFLKCIEDALNKVIKDLQKENDALKRDLKEALGAAKCEKCGEPLVSCTNIECLPF